MIWQINKSFSRHKYIGSFVNTLVLVDVMEYIPSPLTPVLANLPPQTTNEKQPEANVLPVSNLPFYRNSKVKLLIQNLQSLDFACIAIINQSECVKMFTYICLPLRLNNAAAADLWS
jgi:hypothetical protein